MVHLSIEERKDAKNLTMRANNNEIEKPLLKKSPYGNVIIHEKRNLKKKTWSHGSIKSSPLNRKSAIKNAKNAVFPDAKKTAIEYK